MTLVLTKTMRRKLAGLTGLTGLSGRISRINWTTRNLVRKEKLALRKVWMTAKCPEKGKQMRVNMKRWDILQRKHAMMRIWNREVIPPTFLR